MSFGSPLFILIFFLSFLTMFWQVPLFVIHTATNYRYYKMRNHERNQHLEAATCLIMALIAGIAGIFMYYRVNINGVGLFAGSVALNIMCFYEIFPQKSVVKRKDVILQDKYNEKVQEIARQRLDENTWEVRALELIDSIAKGETTLENEELLPMIAFMRLKAKFVEYMWVLPDSVQNHLYYPEFKKEVENMDMEILLQRLGIEIE